jgi:cytochrome c oxidase assembly factor CtaG
MALDTVFVGMLLGGAAVWLASGIAARFRGYGLLRSLSLVAGAALAAAALVSPLDSLGIRGLLTAHVAQHIVLGDLAAPLLLLGLPRQTRLSAQNVLRRLTAGRSRTARVAAVCLSPVGAFAMWVVATYVWFVPAVNNAASVRGVLHTTDHLSFFLAGLLIWLAPFDPRDGGTLLHGLRHGGLPWWGRHLYAMTTRLAMLPPAFGVWLAAGTTYHRPGVTLPFGYSASGDQARAAAVMIGFEMLLFALAVCLGFVFLSVAEGRARSAGRESPF